MSRENQISFLRAGVIAQEICPTQRAPDWWESARFQALCVA